MAQNVKSSVFPVPSQQNVSKFLKGEDPYAKEERELNTGLNTDSRALNESKKELKNLEPVEDPGEEPNSDDYAPTTFKATTAFWIFGVVCLFFFHCFMWFVKLFTDNTWNTWGWTTGFFKYGLIAIGVLYVLAWIVYLIADGIWTGAKEEYDKFISEKKRLESAIRKAKSAIRQWESKLADVQERREGLLLHVYRTELVLPMPYLGTWDYVEAREKFFDLRKKALAVKEIADVKERFPATLKLCNAKMSVFLNCSMKSQAINDEVFANTKALIRPAYLNTASRMELVPMETIAVAELKRKNNGYKSNRLDGYIDQFTGYMNEDISGFFTKYDSSLLEEQVKNLNSVYNATAQVCRTYSVLCKRINNALGVSRLIAYYYLYLGVETLNIIRDNAGGGALKVADDSLSVAAIQNNRLDKIPEFSSGKAFADMVGSVSSDVSTFINNALEDKQMMKYASKNPKQAAMATAAVALFSAANSLIAAWKERNQKVQKLVEMQKAVVEKMKSATEEYTKSVAYTRRALELTEAINKVNDAFIVVYEPLRKKIFEDKNLTNITMVEVQQLALAMRDYKKITNSQL